MKMKYIKAAFIACAASVMGLAVPAQNASAVTIADADRVVEGLSFSNGDVALPSTHGDFSQNLRYTLADFKDDYVDGDAYSFPWSGPKEQRFSRVGWREHRWNPRHPFRPPVEDPHKPWTGPDRPGSPAPVPEPSTWLLLGSGLGFLATTRPTLRRKLQGFVAKFTHG